MNNQIKNVPVFRQLFPIIKKSMEHLKSTYEIQNSTRLSCYIIRFIMIPIRVICLTRIVVLNI